MNNSEFILSRRFDFNNDPGSEPVILRIENKNIGSLQNFIGLTGLPKNGKGKFASAIAASAISRKEVFNIHARLPEERKRVAWIATDESRYDLFKTVALIKTLSGLESIDNKLDVFNTRQDEGKNILSLIKTYLDTYKDCSLLVIDNIGDLLINYNDEGQSKKIINCLKHWSDQFNILIVSVLHLGKGNNTTLGHLGAGLDRYAQSVLRVTKDKERKTYCLTGEMLRSAGDFTPIDILYNESVNQWEQTYHYDESEKKLKSVIATPEELPNTQHRDKLFKIFNQYSIQDYNQLLENIFVYYGRSKKWAKDCLRYLLDADLICKGPGGYELTPTGQGKLFVKK